MDQDRQPLTASDKLQGVVNGAEILTTVAQLGAAVTGFSGIAIAFNRHPGRLGDFEAFRVSILFANSLAAVFLALLPFPFFHLGWSESMIWRTASGVITLFEIVFLAVHFPQARRFLRTHRELFNLKLLTFVTISHAANGVAQLMNALGLFDAKLAVSFSAYSGSFSTVRFNSDESYSFNRMPAERCQRR